MEALFIILATALVCVCCFIVGAKVGQKASKGEDIEIPVTNPVTAWQEHHARKQAQREAQKEQERLDTILQNIDNYDGTAEGQKDVPRG